MAIHWQKYYITIEKSYIIHTFTGSMLFFFLGDLKKEDVSSVTFLNWFDKYTI
jgi:hypothetical protein